MRYRPRKAEATGNRSEKRCEPRLRALSAIALAAPVALLAMSDVELPWTYLDETRASDTGDLQRHNSRPRKGFHRECCFKRAILREHGHPDLLGTLAALFYSLWECWSLASISISKPAPSSPRSFCWGDTEARSRGQAGGAIES
jgi:hypothetical protein